MSFGWDNGLGNNWNININSFPTDKSPVPNALPNTVWHSYRAITDHGDLTFDHNAPTYEGNSSSDVYLYNPPDFWHIYGVHKGYHTWTEHNFPDVWNMQTDIAIGQHGLMKQGLTRSVVGWLHRKYVRSEGGHVIFPSLGGAILFCFLVTIGPVTPRLYMGVWFWTIYAY